MSVVDRILEELGLGLQHFDPVDAAAEQAVIDLLQLAALVDGSSTDEEREQIRRHLDEQDWPDGASPYSYLSTATAKVRAALADDVRLEELMTSVLQRLRCDGDRELALSLMAEMAGLDGQVDRREEALIHGLRRRFDGRSAP